MDLVERLKSLEPGFLPEEIFGEIARLVVTPTIVLVPVLTDISGKAKVLLTKRDSSAKYYPGMYNLPGTVLLSTDKSLDFAIDRLINKELSGLEIGNAPIFVANIFERIDRGMELSLIYKLDLKNEPINYELFDTTDLPENIVKTDMARIENVVESISMVHRLN